MDPLSVHHRRVVDRVSQTTDSSRRGLDKMITKTFRFTTTTLFG